MATAVLPEPVQLMKDHVRQQRGDDRTLRHALLSGSNLLTIQHACAKPLPQQLQQPLVAESAFYQSDQLRVVDTLKERLNVGVQHPVLSSVDRLTDLFHRLVGVPFWPKPV